MLVIICLTVLYMCQLFFIAILFFLGVYRRKKELFLHLIPGVFYVYLIKENRREITYYIARIKKLLKDVYYH